ncbi:hypothetical protein CAPTEDRAFT_196837 [Capitella teleta]|uniref:G-protein coupled receptors family 1 profile domain-containing protein n=1 Tax=Capitella teleta TaxID=283909 RepID=R7VH24_CAPTE|nr:hypothetical protein CAPTEDRAFT_196837 [Capitella teleta]|eukprot:ELU17914.1 hypothetical protein CAPTEDRAFT_196837 [Capitella teleta]
MEFHCELYELLVCVVTIGIVCLFGLAGNITSFFVLLKHSTDKVTIFMLQAICVSDTLLLFASIVMYVLPTIEKHFFGPRSAIEEVPSYVIHVWPFAMMAHTMTIWVTVLVTFTRFRAMCTPHQYKKQTQKEIISKVFLVAVLSALFNLPRFFEHREISFPGGTNTTLDPVNLGDSKIYQVLYSNVAYFLVMYIIPLVSLFGMNTKLIRALKDFRRKRSRLIHAVSTQDPVNKDHVTTPALVNQIFWAALTSSQRECGHFHFYYTKFSDVLVVSNSACNIIIYCMAGKSFRLLFKQELFSRCCKSSEGGVTRV